MTVHPNSTYTIEMATEFCERIAEGHSLRGICQSDDMPDARTITRWLSSNDQFRELYNEARDRQQDTFAAQIIEIADTDPDPQRARNRIDARKWHAAKCAPRRYGDKIELGGTVQIERVFNDDDRARALGLFLQKAQERLEHEGSSE